MTINENKVIEDLKKISLPPEKKVALWSKLDLYALKHPPVKSVSAFAAFLQSVKGLFSVKKDNRVKKGL